jgi:hypothetical protein
MMRRTARYGATALLVGTVGLAATLAFGSTAAFAATGDDDNGVGITVTVTPAPSTPAPAGSAASTPPRTPTKPAVDAVAPVADKPVPADDEVDLGGILFVSGLTSVYSWSINPLDGALDTSFTVRNVSKTTFDSTVRFWVDGPLGNQLSEVADVKVTDLKPGESRTLEAKLGGIGQSTFVQVHAKLSPPKVVEGVKLDPLTRDEFLIIPPWGIAAIAGLGAIGFAGFSLVHFLRRPISSLGINGVPA